MSRYEVALPKLPFLDQLSFANIQGLASLPAVRLERRLGRLPPSVMRDLKVALPIALDLD
jgi:mRNA interferase MazF